VRDRLIELFHVERYESTYGGRGIQRVQVQPLMAESAPRSINTMPILNLVERTREQRSCESVTHSKDEV
jgi:hypothetical protein